MDLSIPDQVRQVRKWCTGQGHSVAVEYIEPGASATDDRRPVFQQMISEACADPAPFEALVVHSLSRFFRDSFEFAFYERKLNKSGVKIISMTQQTGDDPAGEMARKIFSLFDEYQSKENGKHTLRAMQENARQGFLNGSRAPFGYRAIDTEVIGSRGGKRKKLVVDPAEAAIVRKVHNLYLHGYLGNPLGYKGIMLLLNRQGITFRGKPWSCSRVDRILGNPLYIGRYYFNRRSAKDGSWKPQGEWILTQVDPILDEVTFNRVEERRESRNPDRIPPRVVSTPTLLTGLVRCGVCGSGMTIATGKSGRYRYYKCSARTRRGTECRNGNAPMQTVDRMVLTTLTDKVFTDARVRQMLLAVKEQRNGTSHEQQAFLKQLGSELEKNRQATDRLYEAVEAGLLPQDATLTERAHKLQSRRQEILTEMAGIKREAGMPNELLSGKNVRAFCNALRKRLHDPGSSFGKQYLRLLVKDVRITGKEIRMRGSYEALAQTVSIKKLGTPERVPSFIPVWRAPSERIRTASEIPIEVDLKDEDTSPIYMKISEKVLHLRRLGIPYAGICERLGVNRWMALRAVRWAKAHQNRRKSFSR
jgi:DNA invertase Pin-like site-specific DNA recombinase